MSTQQPYAYTECQHIRTSGAKCRAAAVRGQSFCYFHRQIRRRYAITPTVANGETAPSPEAANIALPMLEDRSSIQVALNEVLRALAAGQLDRKRAWLLLYGLQMATQNCLKPDEITDPWSVRDLELTPEGEEVGPLLEM